MNLYFGLRTASYFIASVFPLLAFVCVSFFLHDLMLAVLTACVICFFSAILGRIITGNSFIGMLEGSGILTLSINSSGNITPYLATTDSKNLTLKTPKKLFTSIYDRTIGFYFKSPKKASVEVTEEKLIIELEKEKFSTSYFKLMDKPVLIWNEKTQSFLTKQSLCDTENTMLADYLSLVTLTKIDALGLPLTQLTKTFSEYFKPASFLAMFDNPWVKGIFIFLIILAVVAVVVMFGPEFLNIIQGIGAEAGPSGLPMTPIK
jgi:hypothetical protein